MEILVITDSVVNVIVTLERNLAVSAEDGIWSMTMKVIIFDPQVSFRNKSPRETLVYQTNRHLLGDPFAALLFIIYNWTQPKYPSTQNE